MQRLLFFLNFQPDLYVFLCMKIQPFVGKNLPVYRQKTNEEMSYYSIIKS